MSPISFSLSLGLGAAETLPNGQYSPACNGNSLHLTLLHPDLETPAQRHRRQPALLGLFKNDSFL